MSTKTRIIVIRKSQLLIAGIALLAAILLIALLLHASGSSQKESDTVQTVASDTTATSGTAATSDTAATSGTAATSDTAATSGTAATSDTTATSDVADNTSASDSTSGSSSVRYTPGVYTSTVKLNDTALEVQVVVDENHINSISLTNLDETIETMYPLVSPAMEELSEQIISTQSLTDITYSTSNQYTSMVLYEAICNALEKAAL